MRDEDDAPSGLLTRAELERIHADIAKLMAETRKLSAEAGKMTRETFWYPFALALAFGTLVSSATAVVIKILE